MLDNFRLMHAYVHTEARLHTQTEMAVHEALFYNRSDSDKLIKELNLSELGGTSLSLLEEKKCTLHNITFLIDQTEIFVAVPKVISYGGLEREAEVGKS